MVPDNAAVAPPLLQRLIAICRAALPDSTIIVHGSLAVGIFDTSANVLFAISTTHSSLGVVAVLSSLYPLSTILLARAVLHERLGATRTAGGLIALGGAALIAAG